MTALVHFMRRATVCVYLALVLQLCLYVIPAQSTDHDDNSGITSLDPLQRRSPIDVGINVTTPAFLITIPFSVTSGPSSVSGTATIYFQASRSIKAVGDFGQKFLARISTTTFLFVFEYESGTNLPGHSSLQVTKDVLYLHRVSAQVQAENISFFPWN
ncbi:hypothetical protein FB645_006207 [Coemansia sp. IMI 203386]|nr:hypothetical protein FB645_006207 [Coemansia sp. IMI 203386]